MEKETGTFEEAGNEVLKAIGSLDEATHKLKTDEDQCQATQSEVGRWIEIIGKAIFAIFK